MKYGIYEAICVGTKEDFVAREGAYLGTVIIEEDEDLIEVVAAYLGEDISPLGYAIRDGIYKGQLEIYELSTGYPVVFLKEIGGDT